MLLGAAIGACASSALLAVCSALLVKAGTLPGGAAPLITGAVGAVGAFLSGWFAVKLHKSHGMLMGALAGLMLFAAVMLGAAVTGSFGSPAGIAAKCALFAAFGAVGGIVRVNKRTKVVRPSR